MATYEQSKLNTLYAWVQEFGINPEIDHSGGDEFLPGAASMGSLRSLRVIVKYTKLFMILSAFLSGVRILCNPGKCFALIEEKSGIVAVSEKQNMDWESCGERSVLREFARLVWKKVNADPAADWSEWEFWEFNELFVYIVTDDREALDGLSEWPKFAMDDAIISEGEANLETWLAHLHSAAQ